MNPFFLALPLLAGCQLVDKAGFSTCTGDDCLTTTTDTWEPGCILVDGGGGFARLSDALERAGDGAVVTLCEGEMEESVTITRPVTLEGPGPDLLTWRGAPNEVVLTIQGASSVTVSGIRFAADRTAVEVLQASDVTFRDVVFSEVGATGLRAVDTTGLVVEDATFEAPGYGGIEIDGGSASLARIEVLDPIGFAVRGTTGADVTLSESTISGTLYSEVNTDGTVDDGRAVWFTDDATLHTAGNLLQDNLWGISSYEGGNLDLSGDRIEGGLVGIEAWGGAFDAAGVEVVDPTAYGIYAVPFATDVSLSDVTVTGDPLVVYQPTSDELVEGSILSSGVVIAGDASASLTGVTVEGYNAYGLFLTGTTSAITLEASLQDVAIRDSGLVGLYAPGVDLDLQDVSVTDVRLGAAPWLDETTYSVYVPGGFGAYLGDSTVTWTGGELSRNALAGAWIPTGTATFSGVTIESNGWAGLVGLSAALVVEGSTFRHSAGEWDDGVYGGLALSGGGIYSQDGSLLQVTGCTFEDNLEPDVDPTSDGGTIVYELASRDVFSYYDAQVVVEDSTFTDGSYGLYLTGSGDVSIRRNTWTRYNDYAVDIYANSGTAELSDNLYQDMGGRSIYGTYAAISVTGDTFRNTVGRRYAYTQYDAHGNEVTSYDYTWDDEPIYGYQAELSLEGVTFEDTADGAMYLYNSPLILQDATLQRVGRSRSTSMGNIYAVFYDIPVEATIIGLQATDLEGGDGVQVEGRSELGTATLEIADVAIDGVPGSGVVLREVTDGTVAAVTVSGAGEDGIVLEDAAVAVEQISALDGAAEGLVVSGADSRVTVEVAEIAGHAGDGIRFDAGELGLAGVTSIDNRGWGMVCAAGTRFSLCSDNVFTPNDLGSTSGCDCTD